MIEVFFLFFLDSYDDEKATKESFQKFPSFRLFLLQKTKKLQSDEHFGNTNTSVIQLSVTTILDCIIVDFYRILSEPPSSRVKKATVQDVQVEWVTRD